MKKSLVVAFDYGHFRNIRIEDPAVFPTHGEIFSCDWEDYIEDEDDLKRMREIEEGECWMVERLSIHYSKEKVEALIVLHLSNDFNETFLNNRVPS
ncbi:hypothetical protein [Saccharicrinis aurantiacus]|uniref:hypothetical protein n=1 Tax=Saccharicrinis aurantiacus TaxID=1849719 RepID=UPI00094F6F3E|nr:hypothetical protein [Saccharicrinis aurantiacus]